MMTLTGEVIKFVTHGQMAADKNRKKYTRQPYRASSKGHLDAI